MNNRTTTGTTTGSGEGGQLRGQQGALRQGKHLLPHYSFTTLEPL